MRVTLFLLLILLCTSIPATDLDYSLVPQKITEDIYFFEGANEDFSFSNGGNILNTGVIITNEGVIVINTGPSAIYGEQLRAAIRKITDKPIIRVYISKLHPDHFLGNQAFKDVPLYTLASTRELMQQQASQFTDNMYRLVNAWMKGTEPVIPTHTAKPGREIIGDHEIEILADTGHTPGDLLVFDRTDGVLFAGGVVFHNRAPTTPHADLNAWKKELESISALDFKIIVPSHGPVARDRKPLDQTRSYIDWLDQHFVQAAQQGLSMAELMYLEIPEKFASMAVMPDEYYRSVSHLYPDYEKHYLQALEGGAY